MEKYLHQRILLVGIGGAAWWIMQGFQRCSIAIEGFIVTDPIYETEVFCCGLPLYKAESWSDLPDEKSNYAVVIGIMNPGIDIGKIKEDLQRQGWTNVQTFSEFARKLKNEFKINCCMLEDLNRNFDEEQIQNVYKLFLDTHSKNVFKEFINYCSDLVETSDELIDPVPYYPASLPRWQKDLRIVDCGSYDGEAIKDAIKSDYSIDLAMCLEPDPSNYEKLISKLRDIENIICLPLAVSDQVEGIRFNARGTTGSRIDKENLGRFVQSVTLDCLLPNAKMNLIKMDIEGAEFPALLGARDFIAKSRPGLAISVYHLSGDLIRIPQLLFELLGDSYDYYLRRHSRTIADTIFYAVPREIQ